MIEHMNQLFLLLQFLPALLIKHCALYFFHFVQDGQE